MPASTGCQAGEKHEETIRREPALVTVKRQRGRLSALFVLAVGATLLLLPASPQALDASRPPPQTASEPLRPARIEAAIRQLGELSRGLLAETGIPGLAVAVVWRDEVRFARGFGVRRAGAAAAVDADTVFQIASLSKPVAATVVARQVGRGVLGWDTPVVRHLPWFELADPWVTRQVTVGDLFAHRSGLPDHAGDDLEDFGFGRREILERLRHLPLAPFRAGYAYTNFGLTAAAEAVAAASGTDWASLSEEALYAPLGMPATSSRHADFLSRDNRAVGHTLVDGRFEPRAQRQPDAQSPAGGVSTSVRDFARWMRMVLGQGRLGEAPIVDEQALLQATTAKMVSSPSYAADARPGFYGYGFNVGVEPSGRIALSHSGAFNLGAGASFVLLPSAELGIVAFSNAAPIGAVEALTARFMDLAQFGEITRDWLAGYGQLLGGLTRPVGATAGLERPPEAAPPGPADDYAGRFSNAYFGGATVEADADGLVLRLGPEPQAHRLEPWDGDRFVYTAFGENAPAGSRSLVTFERDGEGRVGALRVELLDEAGQGRFRRADD